MRPREAEGSLSERFLTGVTDGYGTDPRFARLCAVAST